MVFFTASASALFTAMVLASMSDAFEADERENRARYHQWKRLSEQDKKAHPFQYRNDNEKTVNLYSMIVNFRRLVERPINRGRKPGLSWMRTLKTVRQMTGGAEIPEH